MAQETPYCRRSICLDLTTVGQTVVDGQSARCLIFAGMKRVMCGEFSENIACGTCRIRGVVMATKDSLTYSLCFDVNVSNPHVTFLHNCKNQRYIYIVLR